MKTSTRLVTILSAILCLLAALPAVAKQTAEKGWYLNLGLGINWLDQESGHSQPADTGFRLSTACGRSFNQRWALELETGYLRNSSPAVDLHPESTLGQVPLLLNLVHTFWTGTSLKPYVGAGGGVVIATSHDDTGGDAGFQFLVGVRHVIDDRKSIGIGYRFIMLGATSAIAEEPVGDDTLLFDLRLAI
jgi:opacity protein-like surface antigen